MEDREPMPGMAGTARAATSPSPPVDRRRRADFGCLMAFYLSSQLGMISYRDFVYARGIHDFGLADTAGNLFGVGAVAFLVLAVVSPTLRQGLAIVASATLWLGLHEVAQLYLPGRVFDWRDMLATAFGGLLAVAALVGARRTVQVRLRPS